MEPALIVYSTTTLSTALLAQALHRSLTLARVPAHPPLRVDSLPADALPLLAPRQPVVFLLSTTGAGEPNADLKPLWQLLMREGLPADLLETARFAVLGCGDSGYERFNWVGKIWRRRLLALGAEEIAAREGTEGEEGWWADERSSGGLEETTNRFTETLLTSLHKLYYPEPAAVPPPIPATALLPSLYIATSFDSSSSLSPLVERLNLEAFSPSPAASTSSGIRARLESFERMTAPDWTQDVRLITFALPPGVPGSWQPGGIARIQPTNSKSQVQRFFELQPHLDPERSVLLTRRKEVWEPPMYGESSNGGLNGTQSNGHHARPSYDGGSENDSDDDDYYLHHPPPLPSFATEPITPFELVRRSVDLSAIPTRAFFQWLRLFATDEREVERLNEFLDPVEGPDDVYTYATQPRRSVLETLADFRGISLPLDYLPEVLPPLRPREFSIACDSSQGKLELAVAMVEYKTGLKARRVGLCTAFFQSLAIGDELRIDLVEGTMALPAVAGRPIVCVGPGTGVAPLRALIQRRVALGETFNTVYFGCRKRDCDFLFRTDWERWAAKGLLELRTAFSRDQEDKLYVQHLIEEDSEAIYRKLVSERGSFYISGSSNAMPRAVKKAVVRCFMKEHLADGADSKGVSEEAARRMVERMEDEGRWSEECWS